MEEKKHTCSLPEKNEATGGLLIMNTLTCREKGKKVILVQTRLNSRNNALGLRDTYLISFLHIHFSERLLSYALGT